MGWENWVKRCKCAEVRWRYRVIAGGAIEKEQKICFSTFGWGEFVQLSMCFLRLSCCVYLQTARSINNDSWKSLFCCFQVQKSSTRERSSWTCATHLWVVRRRRIFPAIWWRATKPPFTITTIKTKWTARTIHRSTTTKPISSRRKIRATAGAKSERPKSINLTWTFKLHAPARLTRRSLVN